MSAAITHVRHVGLVVPEFEAERSFLLDPWGLKEVGGDDGLAYFAAPGSPEPYVLRLRRGGDRRAELLALAALDRAGVDGLAASLPAQGIELVAPPHELSTPGGGYGLRFFDLDGRLVEVSADVAPRQAESPPPRSGLPLALSHAVFHTPDLKATVGFYEAALGLRVSDELDSFMCFLRGAGRKHHCMAFLAGPPTLNHVAFEMANFDEMMRAMGRALQAGAKLNWGPGRHTAGDNTFAYFHTPAGNVLEFTAELEELPEDWTPRTMPRRPEIVDQWQTGRVAGPAAYPPLSPDPGLWCSEVP